MPAPLGCVCYLMPFLSEEPGERQPRPVPPSPLERWEREGWTPRGWERPSPRPHRPLDGFVVRAEPSLERSVEIAPDCLPVVSKRLRRAGSGSIQHRRKQEGWGRKAHKKSCGKSRNQRPPIRKFQHLDPPSRWEWSCGRSYSSPHQTGQDPNATILREFLLPLNGLFLPLPARL